MEKIYGKMKTLILLFICFQLQAQIKPTGTPQAQQMNEKYLMPVNDTMDVIRIPYLQVANFTMDVGKYSRIEPVPVDTLNPTGAHFLPHRCLYDEDMTSIRDVLEGLNKRYLVISQRKLVLKEGQVEP